QTAASSTDTTIAYRFSGTATGGSDFINTTTSVTIPAGATTASIMVPTIIDGLVEPTETVIVTLRSTSNPQIPLSVATAATGTISDNVTPPPTPLPAGSLPSSAVRLTA